MTRMSLIGAVLFSNDLFSVRDVPCRHAPRKVSEEQFSDSDVVILPVRGAFMEHYAAKQCVLADPNIALVFPSGSSARFSHPVDSRHDCLVFEMSSSFFREALYAASGSGSPQIANNCLLPLHDIACRGLLLYRLQHGLASSLEIEET